MNMKKLVVAAMIVSAMIAGCSKGSTEESTEKTPTLTDKLIGTKWTAIDDIAELIYGRTCTTSIEFLTETKCQQINIRKTNFLPGTFIEEGTWRTKGDSLYFTIKSRTIGGVVSGSVLQTNMNTVSGGKRNYTKDY